MPRPHKPSYFHRRNCWRFTLNGVQRYICKGVRPDQRPARDGVPRVVWDAMDRIIRESEGRATAGSDPTLDWLAQRYLGWLEKESKEGRLTAKQFANRRVQLAHLVDFLDGSEIRPGALDVEWADGFFAWLRSRKLSAHYVHNVGGAVRAMLRWAARPVSGREPARLIAANPLEGYAWPRQPGAVRGYVGGAVVRRFLRWAWGRARWEDNDRGGLRSKKARPPEPTVGELARHGRGGGNARPPASAGVSLKRRFDRVFLLMLRFQRLTGCRPGEACGLRWDEVTPAPVPGVRWDPTLVTVHPGRVKTRHQTDRARKIYVTPPVARILRALERLPGRHPEVVFPHMRGTNAARRGHLDALAGEPWPDGSAASAKVATLRKAAIAAGVAGVEGVGPTRLIAYANRHGYASEGASLGFSDGQIAEQMGNTPEVMRRVYSHTIADRAAERAHEIAEKRRGAGRGRKAGSG